MRRSVRSAIICGYRTNTRARCGEIRRARLDREKYVSYQPAPGVVALSGGGPYHAGASANGGSSGCAPARFVRHLHPMPGGMPHARFSRTLRSGCPALHFLPHYRTSRFHPGRIARSDGRCAAGVRHLSGRVPLESQGAPQRCAGVSAKVLRGQRWEFGGIRIVVPSRPGMGRFVIATRVQHDLPEERRKKGQMARHGAKRLRGYRQFESCRELRKTPASGGHPGKNWRRRTTRSFLNMRFGRSSDCRRHWRQAAPNRDT